MREIFYNITPKNICTFSKENSPFTLDDSGWKTVVEACLQLPGIVSCEFLPLKINRIHIIANETFSGNISLAIEPLDLNSNLISQDQLLRERRQQHSL